MCLPKQMKTNEFNNIGTHEYMLIRYLWQIVFYVDIKHLSSHIQDYFVSHTKIHIRKLIKLVAIKTYTVHRTLAASQFAYLYYALKVCTLFVKKKYILLSM